MASVPGIPGSFVQILKDIYFETMFNAHLVLHQKRFEAALAAGRVPDHLVLSMCAWAANFYHDSNGRATLKEDGFMIDWATRAGKLVFAAAEELQEYNMVTHSILTIFWASQGQWRRAVLHKLAAFAQIHVIGLHPKCSSQEQQWQAELRRRRFWACYCMDCHSSLDLHLTHSLSDPSSVPLPWPESNFNAEKMPSSNVMLHYDPSQPCGIYAAAMQALNLWYFSSEDVIVINGLTTVSLNARVTSLSAVRPCPSNTDRMTNATLYEIDGQLSRWWTVNPYNLTRNSIAAWPDHELSKVLMINFVYHQSFVAIHATRVPLFCGIRLGSDDVTSSSARLVSAQVALNHATSICDLAWLIMSSKKKMIRSLPNMVAYALYCGCIIQLPFLHCTDAGVQADAHARVEATLGLLEELGAFWRGPTIMKRYISIVKQVHLESGAFISNEPRHLYDDTQLKVVPGLLSASRTSFLDFLRWARQGHDTGYSVAGAEPSVLHDTDSPSSLSTLDIASTARLARQSPDDAVDAAPQSIQSDDWGLGYPATDTDMLGWLSGAGMQDWFQTIESAAGPD